MSFRELGLGRLIVPFAAPAMVVTLMSPFEVREFLVEVNKGDYEGG